VTAKDNTLTDGASVEVQGSSSRYTLSRKGEVYMCSCPAWRNQGAAVDRRTCKHLRAYLGAEVEARRVGEASPAAAGGSGSAAVRATTSSAAARQATAPPLLLAHRWEVDHDPTGWWMSEKLDGVRAYWDGEAFVSRLGNRFIAPDWFVADLPADTLDGELWVDRKKFQKTIGIVRSGAAGDAWREVRYVVFDAPNARGAFEDRLAHARKVLTRAGSPYAHCHDHDRCRGIEHLRDELVRVEALGGEGLMLREPGSAYVVGRSTSLLKVKTFHDGEARVVQHAPGTGKHKGRLGALVVELPDGTRFNIGTGMSDKERHAPPKIGAVITFRYQELSDDGVPRFPSYVGERIDVELPARSSAKAPAKPAAKPPAQPSAKPAVEPAAKPPVQPSAKPSAKAPAKPAAKSSAKRTTR
jgi:DNA ligase 1